MTSATQHATAAGERSPISEDWVIGFIEGEGSFCKATYEYNTYPQFNMLQRDDVILEEIAEVLPIETKVYERSHDGLYALQFSGKEKIKAMIEFLDGRLHADYSKKRFARWKRIYRVAYGEPALPEANN